MAPRRRPAAAEGAPGDAPVSARALLTAGPDGYTPARDAAVKARRAAGDREGAAALKALRRPALALWAVLAAAEDEAHVRAAVETTSTLGEVQASSAERERLAAAMAVRRTAVERVTDDALDALAPHDRAGPGSTLAGRRDEVRALVDRLSRHPELLPAWLDGTLRDLPDDDLGFSPFAGLDVGLGRPAAPAETAAEEPPAVKQSSAVRTPAREATAPAGDEPRVVEEPPGPDPRRVEAARRALERADAEVAGAEPVRAGAEQQLERAREAVTAAQRALETAEQDADRARQRLDDAQRARDAAQARFEELTG